MKIGKCISGNIDTTVLSYLEHPRKGNIFVTHDKVSTTLYTEYQKANDVILSLPII